MSLEERSEEKLGTKNRIVGDCDWCWVPLAARIVIILMFVIIHRVDNGFVC